MADSEKHDTKDGRKCFECGEAGRIAKNCVNRNNKTGSGDQIDTALVTVARRALLTKETCQKSDKRVWDSGFSKHICKNKTYFSTFVYREGVVQVGKNEVVPSYGVGTVPMTTL